MVKRINDEKQTIYPYLGHVLLSSLSLPESSGLSIDKNNLKRKTK